MLFFMQCLIKLSFIHECNGLFIYNLNLFTKDSFASSFLKGLPHLVGRVITSVFGGSLNPLVRFRWILSIVSIFLSLSTNDYLDSSSCILACIPIITNCASFIASPLGISSTLTYPPFIKNRTSISNGLCVTCGAEFLRHILSKDLIY